MVPGYYKKMVPGYHTIETNIESITKYVSLKCFSFIFEVAGTLPVHYNITLFYTVHINKMIIKKYRKIIVMQNGIKF